MRSRTLVTAGFTLIELMVTLAILAVLMAIAAPNFTTYQRNSELTSITNSLVAAINSARGEAMKRGRYAMVVPVDKENWSKGWLAFVDIDRSQDYDPTTDDILIFEREAMPSYVTVSGNGSSNATEPYFMFDPVGYPKTKGGGFASVSISIARNDVSDDQIAAETRRIILSSTGRVRSCKPAAYSTCTSDAIQ